jgi:transposase
MRNFTSAFRSKMVQRMLVPNGISAGELSRRTGIPSSTLKLWRQQAMNGSKKTKNKKPTGPRRPEDWSAEERMQALFEAERMEPSALGEFLRREGLHEATLTQWREVATSALATGRDPKMQRIAELERNLARKDKALAEAAALLVLQKKVRALWAVADDDIVETNESASEPSSMKR